MSSSINGVLDVIETWRKERERSRLPVASVRIVSVCLLVLFVVVSSPDALFSADSMAVEFFERKIRPALVKHCYECHSATSKNVGGNLRLDFRQGLLDGGESGPAVTMGDADSSLLILAMNYEGLEMPPSGKLPDHLIDDFRKWIELGLADPRVRPDAEPAGQVVRPDEARLWSIQPLADVAVPLDESGWSDGPLDQFVSAQHRAMNLTPVSDASPRDLLRRVSFDLIGLPPTSAELEDFEKDCSPGHYASVVDRLLASPRFGERWGRYWLDVARFAESNGNDRNVIFPHAWRYRDYVIRSFNADKPFDQFVREQIAGDLLPSADWKQRDEQLIATGFLTLGSKVLGEGDKELFRMNLIDEQIDVMSRAFLGLTVSCARCHDHKFDPVPTSDYYALAGVFGSTESLYGPMTNANQFGFDRPLQPIGEHGEELDGPAKEYRKQVAEATNVRNKARSSRYGFVRKKAALETEQKKTKDASRLAEIAEEIRVQEAEITEWDRKIEELDAELKKLTDNPPEFPDYCMAVREHDEPADCAIRIRGEPKRKGDVVPRGVLSLFGEAANAAEATTAQQSGRKELAEWLVTDAHPLTARVAVNRLWQRLFGRGLVETPDSFGHMGSRPSHPQLLDWLARRFITTDWSVKQMIREIVLSRTYRLSSDHSSFNSRIDPGNIRLWRASVRRLDAESLRDAMLSVSGELIPDPPEGSVISTFEDREFNSRIFPTDEQLHSLHRSVYLPIARYWVPDVLREFDFADPSLVVGKRTERTMVSQSLFLMNSSFMMDRARQVAADIVSLQDSERAATAFQRILLREPTSAEADGLRQLVSSLTDDGLNADDPRPSSGPESVPAGEAASQDRREETLLAGWTAACQTLLMSAEFRYLP